MHELTLQAGVVSFYIVAAILVSHSAIHARDPTNELDGDSQQMGPPHHLHPNLLPLRPALHRCHPAPPVPGSETHHAAALGPKDRQGTLTTHRDQRVGPDLQQPLPPIRRCELLPDRSRLGPPYYGLARIRAAAKPA